MTRDISQLSERLRTVVLMRETGKTSAQIGVALNLTPNRVGSLYRQALRTIERQQKDGIGPLEGLSVRAVNCLQQLKLNDRAAIHGALASGVLHPHNSHARGYGWAMHGEIHRWLGLPVPHRTRRLTHCPHCGKPLASPPVSTSNELRDAAQ